MRAFVFACNKLSQFESSIGLPELTKCLIGQCAGGKAAGAAAVHLLPAGQAGVSAAASGHRAAGGLLHLRELRYPVHLVGGGGHHHRGGAGVLHPDGRAGAPRR